MAYFITLLALCGFLLFIIAVFGVETLAIFSFRLSCAFLFLYVVHMLLDDFNVFIPINIFSAATIALLGFPGILCVGVLTILQ